MGHLCMYVLRTRYVFESRSYMYQGPSLKQHSCLHFIEDQPFWRKISALGHEHLSYLGPLYIRAHLELGPFGLEVGLNLSPTLQSGP